MRLLVASRGIQCFPRCVFWSPIVGYSVSLDASLWSPVVGYSVSLDASLGRQSWDTAYLAHFANSGKAGLESWQAVPKLLITQCLTTFPPKCILKEAGLMTDTGVSLEGIDQVIDNLQHGNDVARTVLINRCLNFKQIPKCIEEGTQKFIATLIRHSVRLPKSIKLVNIGLPVTEMSGFKSHQVNKAEGVGPWDTTCFKTKALLTCMIGSEPAFAWRDSGKPFREKNLSSPKRDSNLDLPVLSSLAQHETNALTNFATEASNPGVYIVRLH
uniref:Uncharacterized protein n=1 Tax=Timema tahoe TaxID=61484 RepID=A0A7R9IRN8_9NEOP|nr:unnamed protein product [Timema tahoe]